jgi:hypothetical protein
MVLANLSFGVVPLRLAADGSASGQFVAEVAGFIEARQADGPSSWTASQLLDTCLGHTPDPTTGDGEAFGGVDDEEFGFFWQLVTPGVTWCGLVPEDDEYIHCLGHAETGSWARAHRQGGSITVHQTGPRRLWDELEDIHARWRGARRPDHDRLGLTVHPDGAHRLWVDEPDSPLSWDITRP